jgi:hypothetical protein
MSADPDRFLPRVGPQLAGSILGDNAKEFGNPKPHRPSERPDYCRRCARIASGAAANIFREFLQPRHVSNRAAAQGVSAGYPAETCQVKGPLVVPALRRP